MPNKESRDDLAAGRVSEAEQQLEEAHEWEDEPNSLTGIPPENYGRVLRYSPDAYLVLDRKCIMREVSDAYLAQVHKTRGELLGLNIFAVFPDNPYDPEATGQAVLRESLMKVIETKKPGRIEGFRYDMRTEDGEWVTRWWQIVNVPIPDDGGQVKYILSRVEEITELVRLRALEARQKEYNKTRHTLEPPTRGIQTTSKRILSGLGYGLLIGGVTVGMSIAVTQLGGSATLQERIDRNGRLTLEATDVVAAGEQGLRCLLTLKPNENRSYEETQALYNKCYAEFDKLVEADQE